MLLTDPHPTRFDLNFSLFGIPVRIHPYFWLVGLLFTSRSSETPPNVALIWVAALFISILAHELGHALAAKYFGWPPAIVLFAFGGLTSYRPTQRNPAKQIVITLLGPGTGFLLAFLLSMFLTMRGHAVHFLFSREYPWISWEIDDFNTVSQNLFYLVWFLLKINIFWGLLNLLPIFPLDGGRLCHELLSLIGVGSALAIALQISFVVAGICAVFALVHGEIFLAIFFAYMAYSSLANLQMFRGGGYGGRGGLS